MWSPTQDEPSAAEFERDVGALIGTEPGRQIADESETCGVPPQLRCSRSAGRDRRWRGRNPAQQRSQNAGGGIELGGFSDTARLRFPEQEPGPHAVRQADHQQAEHRHDDQHFE